MKKIVLIIDEDGNEILPYTDDMLEMVDGEKIEVHRFSLVEFNNSLGLWEVIKDGKVLYRARTRKEALKWEWSWMLENLGKE